MRPRRADASSSGDEEIPALVIGSGFGGAVSALRLGQAGIRTIVLERGQRWPTSPLLPGFSSETVPDGRGFWFKDTARFPSMLAELPVSRYAGVMDYSTAGDMDVFRAAAVGGGSIVYSGVCVLPRREYFERLFPRGLSYDALTTRYAPRVQAMLRFSVLPADLYGAPTWRHARVWDEQARKAGLRSSPVNSVFSWTMCRSELRLRSRPSATIGESNFGNANGAKYDLTQNYLPAAESTGHVTVRPLTIVTEIGLDGDRYAVSVRHIDPHGALIAAKTYFTNRLFLCAGSMGTSELLVRARDTGTMPRLSDEVGQGWGTNGDTLGFRSLGAPTGLAQAAPCASEIHDTTFGVPTTAQNWWIPHTVESTSLVTLGMAVDTKHRGEFTFDPRADAVRLSWRSEWDDELVDSHRRLNARIADVNGVATGVPAFRPDVVSGWTAHPLGGAVIGRATDLYGRLHGYKGLYVNDGALIPGNNGAANPSLMIASLAERNIEHLIAADF